MLSYFTPDDGTAFRGLHFLVTHVLFPLEIYNIYIYILYIYVNPIITYRLLIRSGRHSNSFVL